MYRGGVHIASKKPDLPTSSILDAPAGRMRGHVLMLASR